ncbi:hypothetical protein MW871_16225 [Flavobacterium sp. I-SCBP12n]|uniref:Uncharacterized protein n=1 Tax=Flavobacterium pygoscelis TaxID=2893176 RepID=A0A9X2BMC3_9FLAO|nr:hypothetical protein [Flavobacterium pygoscelis]MCK8143439.1 hypothetical protein [Flavobacterium pygoscelis]
MNRQKRRIITQIYISILFLLFSTYGGYSLINDKFQILSTQYTIIISLTIFIFSTYLLLKAYLDLSELSSNTSKFSLGSKKEKNQDSNESSLDFLMNIIDSFPELKKEFMTKMVENCKDLFTQEFPKSLSSSIYLNELSEIDTNIKRQIKRLVYNSNLNLIIGILINSVGIIILFFSIYNLNDYSKSNIIPYFLPRISIVVFMQIFAFFFLKLYKECLNDIKFFENEITNLNFKITALKIALDQNEKEIINQLILNYSKVDRNSTFKKAIENKNNESGESQNESLQYLTKVLDKVIELIPKK